MHRSPSRVCRHRNQCGPAPFARGCVLAFRQAALTLSSYRYEVRIELAGGDISVQNTGEITVKPSKFVNFP
jgi:hypothetical protein